VSPEDIVEYQPPRLPEEWTVDDEHATVGMRVSAAGHEGALASVWLYEGDPERADVVTDAGLVNVAWDRLEVIGR